MTDLVPQPAVTASFIDEWERQPGEPTKAWKAFVIFRDIGEERGVAQVRDKAGFPTSMKMLTIWATRHRWIERAAAYDRMVDRRRQRAHIDEVEAMARRQVHIGQTLQSHGLEFVKEQLATPEQRAKGLNANAALRYIEKGVDLEREGLGMNEKDQAGDVNIQVNVLDAQTRADVFDTIDRMAENYDEVRKMMQERSTVAVEDTDIEDAELVEG